MVLRLISISNERPDGCLIAFEKWKDEDKLLEQNQNGL